MQIFSGNVDIARFWPFFAVLFVIAFPAFYPTYFAPGLGASGRYIHLHASSASLWMIALIAQPWLIRSYRYELHRTIGRISFVLAPVILISMILLANFRIRTVTPDAYPAQTYVLYLQFMLAGLFALSYGLALYHRREVEIHARFMVCTGLTLIDPVFARLLYWVHPDSVLYHQWVTFGLTDFILLILIWVERRNARARWVFPAMLLVFLLAQIPALFLWTEYTPWQSFARWFQSVPLT